MMNTISNMLKYMALPLSFLVLSTSQAAQISDKDKSYSTYSFSNNLLVEQTNQTGDDAKDDEKIDYNVKKSTGLSLLPYDQWPKNRKIVYSPSLSKKENKETLINKGNDRREKIDKLLLKLLPNKEPFDIACYVVKVHAYFGCRNYDGKNIEGQGTATIIKIKKGIIYLLTCAHNVIKYEENLYGTDDEYHAKHVSFFYQEKEYPCNDYYVHPKYAVNKGKDVAIITSHRGYGIKFPYVSFPQIASITKGKYTGYVIGFPGEKEKKGELHGMSGDLAVKEVSVEYEIDTSEGQSGSSVWAEINGVYKIIGVHAHGRLSYNCGPLLNNEFIKWEQTCWVQVQEVYKKQEAQLLTEQLSKKESQLNKTAKALEEAQQLVEKLKKQLEDKHKEKMEEAKLLNDQLIKKDTVINDTKTELNKTAKQLKKTKKDLETANKQNIDLKNQIKSKEKTIKNNNKVINEKIIEINKTAKKLEVTQDEHKIENEKTQQFIQQLKKQLENKDKRLEKLTQFKGKSLPKDLSGQDLSGYDFTGCHFTYTNLTDTNLENTCLTNTTCDYQKAFQDHLKENKCEGGGWYKKNLPKDLKSIAEVYPKLKNHADKVKLLHIACGLSRLPLYTKTEFYIKSQYWSCALLQLKNKGVSLTVNSFFYSPKLICSLESDLNYDVRNYCWSTEYPQKDDVNLEEKDPDANFGTYLTHFNNGLVKYKCKSEYNSGFNWYKGNIGKNIKGLQKAYPNINNEELRKEACQIGCVLSKTYQIRGMLFLFHYLFYQNRLIRLKNSVGVMVKNDIHYNTENHRAFLGWSHGKK